MYVYIYIYIYIRIYVFKEQGDCRKLQGYEIAVL